MLLDGLHKDFFEAVAPWLEPANLVAQIVRRLPDESRVRTGGQMHEQAIIGGLGAAAGSDQSPGEIIAVGFDAHFIDALLLRLKLINVSLRE
jgi:hypothetical protein